MVGMMRRAWAWLVGRLSFEPAWLRGEPWRDGPFYDGDASGAPSWEPPPEGVAPRVMCPRCGLIQAITASCARCGTAPLPDPFDAVRERVARDGDRMVTEEEVTMAIPIPAVTAPEAEELVILGKVMPSLVCPRCKRATQLVGDKLFAESVACSTCHATIVNLRPRPRPDADPREHVWDSQLAEQEDWLRRRAARSVGLPIPEDHRVYGDWRDEPAAGSRRDDEPEDEDIDDDEEDDLDIDDDEEEEEFDDDDGDDDEDGDDEEAETEPLHAPAVGAGSSPGIVDLGTATIRFTAMPEKNPPSWEDEIPTVTRVEMKITDWRFERPGDVPGMVAADRCSHCRGRSVRADGVCVECGWTTFEVLKSGTVRVAAPAEPPARPPVVPKWVYGRADV